MKIVQIRTTPLALPLREPYHWAGRVDTSVAVILIEVETDAGIVGVGECAATLATEGLLHSLRGMVPFFIDASPFDVERLCARARFLGGFNELQRFSNLVLASLEMALWDIIGKATDRPVFQLLGGAYREQVDLISAPDLTPRQGMIGPIERPGLGFELDWDAVGRAAERYRRHRSLHPNLISAN